MSSREGPSERPKLPAPAHAALGRASPSGDAGLTEVQRLSALLHEIRNLLDGSLRYVLLARKAIAGQTSTLASNPLTDVQRQLDIAAQAMERMSSLAHLGMQGPSMPVGSPLAPSHTMVTLGEAVRHAVEVMRPRADEHRVTIKSSVAPRLADTPSGPLYTLMLNTLRNAVDANVRAGGLGVVEIVVMPCPGPTSNDDDCLWMSIEVRDEGEGILPQVARRAFDYAYSGTGLGSGIGLAVARSVVEELKGKIGIATRKDRGQITRPGACVRALVPVQQSSDETIGEKD